MARCNGMAEDIPSLIVGNAAGRSTADITASRNRDVSAIALAYCMRTHLSLVATEELGGAACAEV